MSYKVIKRHSTDEVSSDIIFNRENYAEYFLKDILKLVVDDLFGSDDECKVRKWTPRIIHDKDAVRKFWHIRDNESVANVNDAVIVIDGLYGYIDLEYAVNGIIIDGNKIDYDRFYKIRDTIYDLIKNVEKLNLLI